MNDEDQRLRILHKDFWLRNEESFESLKTLLFSDKEVLIAILLDAPSDSTTTGSYIMHSKVLQSLIFSHSFTYLDLERYIRGLISLEAQVVWEDDDTSTKQRVAFIHYHAEHLYQKYIGLDRDLETSTAEY